MKLMRALGLASVMFILAWQAAAAQQVWPKLTVTETPGTFDFITHVTHAGDGSGRLFIVELQGVIRIVKDGQVLSTPFLDIRDRVGQVGEGGLLSVAFPPDHETSGVFYVYYTSKEDQVPPDGSIPDEPNGSWDTVVSRFRVTDDPDIADPSTEERILVANHPQYIHFGGQLAFGPDGYLYIGIGDSGFDAENWLADPLQAAQNTNTLLGKLLRIDVSESITYTVPVSNPYSSTAGYRPEIWALGFRNPWRFSFDRLTGDLFIADVGHFLYEEINFQPSESLGGENYGWNVMEGNHCSDAPDCDTSAFVLPVVEYSHNGSCAVIGGHVYRGDDYPTLAGIYIYGDLCTKDIWGLRRVNDQWETRRLLQRNDLSLVTFGEDEAGNLYVPFMRAGDGQYGLYRLEVLPTVTLTITKTVVGQTPDTPWQFNGSDDIGAFTLPAAGGNITFSLPIGTYTVTETPRSGYATEVACTDGASADGASIAITLTSEIDLGCTFTNTYNLGTVAGRIYVSSGGSDQPGAHDGIGDAMVALYSTTAITPSKTTAAVRAASLLTTTDPITTTSQVDGNYILTNVPAGTYTVTVTLPAGFEPLDSQLIEVVGGMTTTVDFIATPLPVDKKFYLPVIRD